MYWDQRQRRERLHSRVRLPESEPVRLRARVMGFCHGSKRWLPPMRCLRAIDWHGLPSPGLYGPYRPSQAVLESWWCARLRTTD